MKERYLFPVSAGIAGLDPYSALEAKRGSLRLIVPSSGSNGPHLLTIIGVVFGYFGAVILITGSPFYQQAAPWRYPYFSVAITLAIVAGFFALLVWEERSVLNWTLRFTSRHPREIRQVQPLTLRSGRFFQELTAVIDGKEVLLRIEASPSRVASAISLSRASVSQLESRTDPPSVPGVQQRSRLAFLLKRLSPTPLKIRDLITLLFSLPFPISVWFLIQDPLNWIWILATILLGLIIGASIGIVAIGRRMAMS